MKPYSDTDEGEAIMSAVNALVACVAFARETESDAAGFFKNWNSNMNSMLQQRPDMKRPDASEVLAAATDARKQARSAKQAEADGLADAAQKAMQEVKATLDASVAETTGTRAFRVDVMKDANRAASLSIEAEAQLPSQWLDVYASLCSRGEDENADLYELAVAPQAREIVGMSASQLRARVGGLVIVNGSRVSGANAYLSPERRDACERERVAAQNFLEAVKNRKAWRIPEAVSLALEAYAQLTAIYCTLIGNDAMMLSPAAYAKRFNVRGGYKAYAPTNPLDVVTDWVERLGAGASAALPGKR
jgi:hypothetical protein